MNIESKKWTRDNGYTHFYILTKTIDKSHFSSNTLNVLIIFDYFIWLYSNPHSLVSD